VLAAPGVWNIYGPGLLEPALDELDRLHLLRGLSTMAIPPELTAAIEALIPKDRSPRRLLVYATVALYEYYLAPDGTVFDRDLDSLRSAEPVDSVDEIREAYAEAAKRYPTLAALATIEPVAPPTIPLANWRERTAVVARPPAKTTSRPSAASVEVDPAANVRTAAAPTSLDATLAIGGMGSGGNVSSEGRGVGALSVGGSGLMGLPAVDGGSPFSGPPEPCACSRSPCDHRR